MPLDFSEKKIDNIRDLRYNFCRYGGENLKLCHRDYYVHISHKEIENAEPIYPYHKATIDWTRGILSDRT